MKTKKLILFCIISLFCKVQAQKYQYHPIVNEELAWSYCDIRGVENYYDLTYYRFSFIGDILINDMQYKKVYREDCSGNKLYMGAFRENGKQIYGVSDQFAVDNIEQLIYDFNMEEGDSIQSPYTTTDFFIQ